MKLSFTKTSALLLTWHLSQVSAQAYQKKILEVGSAFKPEQHGVWTMADWDGDNIPDLCYIKTTSTDSGKIEVHCATGASTFRTVRDFATVIDAGQGTKGTYLMRDFTGDGRADLIYIKTVNPQSNFVEVHVASADSNFKQFVLEVPTVFAPEDNGIWTMSDNGDLVYLKTRETSTGTVEVHIASRSSGYKNFAIQVPTGFVIEDSGTWCIAPKRTGQFPDLYYIKTRGGVKNVYVHAFSAASKWQTPIVDVASSFPAEELGFWEMVDWSHAAFPDLVYIKVESTGTGMVEVHIAQHG